MRAQKGGIGGFSPPLDFLGYNYPHNHSSGIIVSGHLILLLQIVHNSLIAWQDQIS